MNEEGKRITGEVHDNYELSDQKDTGLYRFAEDQFPIGKPRIVTDLDDDFERAADEYFSETKEPIFTVNRNEVYPNAACVRMLPESEYVEILISRKHRMLALKPCDEFTSGRYHWSTMKNGKLQSLHRKGIPFVARICALMGWNPNDRYKIKGSINPDKNGKMLASFDLECYKHYFKEMKEGKPVGRDKQVFDFNGRFGPTYTECKRTYRVNTVEDFVVMSEEAVEQEVTEQAQTKDQVDHIMETDNAPSTQDAIDAGCADIAKDVEVNV